MKVPCPHCDGGGACDYWGEYYPCECCNEEDSDDADGWVETTKLAAFNAKLAAMDAEIDRLMAGIGQERVEA